MTRLDRATYVLLGASLVACSSSSSSPEPSSPEAGLDADASAAADVDSGGADAVPVDTARGDESGCDARATAPPTFVKKTLDPAYRAEGVGVLDVNNDGHLDVVTDQYWYEGPALTPHEIRSPATFSTTTEYAHCFGVFPRDLDGDGFLDVVIAPHVTEAMYWYRNPRGARDEHWTPHLIAPAGVSGLETPNALDVFRDGRPPVLLTTDSPAHAFGWSEPSSDPTLPWTLHPIDTGGSGFSGWMPYAHGLGVGDVDLDGRRDVLTGSGWFQQTDDRAKWTFHPVAFGPDPLAACSAMFTYDFDGDGRSDILCARPHDYGLYWFQQQAGATFVAHEIDATLSEMHALRFEDLDADGVPEIITGKRWLAHGNGGDPGSADPSLLVYYVIHAAGTPGVSFERHVIDSDSGVGGSFAIGDVDGDCKQDVVTANKKGLFVFTQR